MITCAGCDKPAEYLVHETEQPHCKSCMLEAVESRCWTIVRWLEDAVGNPNQSE